MLLLLTCPVELLAAVGVAGVLHSILLAKLLLLFGAMLLLAVGASELSLAVIIIFTVWLLVIGNAIGSVVLLLVVSITVVYAMLLLVRGAVRILSVIAAKNFLVLTVASAIWL